MTDGRFALITGGAQGIGFATAKRFLENGFGGVLLLDRNGAKLKDAAAALSKSGRVETLEGDLLDMTLPPRAVDAAVRAFGRLDVLINAAGNTERCGIMDTTPDAYERLFGANVRAPLFLMQEALKPVFHRTRCCGRLEGGFGKPSRLFATARLMQSRCATLPCNSRPSDAAATRLSP